MSQYSIDLRADEARTLRQKLLDHGGYAPAEREYTLFCFEGMGVNVAYYAKRGKLVVQGKEADTFVTTMLGKAAPPAPETPAQAEIPGLDLRPHFGIDESGKGDYFGPLVVAGVFSDESTAPALHRLGCRDSKTISSDTRIATIAEKIKALPGIAYEVVCIGPARYNALYEEMKNLNRLLAWAHARVIAALHEKAPACPRALSDQFANEWVLRRALGARAVPIKLEQRPRAEQDVAVAAASILARARFVEWMKQTATAAGCDLPLGCAPHVVRAAKAFVAKHGAARLSDVAKLHFKVTAKII